MEREARCCNTYCLRVGVLWFYVGFREGPGGPKSLQKTSQNRLKKQCIFEVKNASKIEAKMRPQGTTN